jgi:hypothetical protein
MTFEFRTRSSHVRTFESCGRKWYLNEVCGIPDKETEAKRFGTEMHLILEHWLRDGKMPGRTPEAMAAKRSIPYLPAPGAGLLVEHKIERVLADGTIYTGAIDVADLRPKEQLLKQLKDPNKLNRLLDHKSTASLRYAKTADELSRDVSAVAYAMEVRRKVKEIFGIDEEVIHGRWNYVPRLGNEPAMPVEFTITRAAQRERWAQTLESVGKMRKLAEQRPAWQDVTPNYQACDSYGGCQFRAQCALAKARSATVNNAPEGRKGIEMGLFDDLKNKKPVGQGVAAPAPQAPAEQPQAASTPASPLQALLARKKAPTVAAIVATAPAQPEPVTTSKLTPEEVAADPDFEASGFDPTDAELEEGVSVGVNPSDAAAADLQKDTVEKKTKRKRLKTLEPVPNNGPQPPQSASTVTIPALPPDEVKQAVEQTQASASSGYIGIEPEASGVEFRAVSSIVTALRTSALRFADPTKTAEERAVALAWFAAAELIESGQL